MPSRTNNDIFRILFPNSHLTMTGGKALWKHFSPIPEIMTAALVSYYNQLFSEDLKQGT